MVKRLFLLAGYLLPFWSQVAMGQINVSVPDLEANQGDVINVDVTVSQINNSDAVISYQFDVLFDASVLKPVGASVSGTITPSSWSFVSNPNAGTGKMSVGAFDLSGTNLTGAGTLVTLSFEVIGDPGTSTDITLSNFLFNNGTPSVNIQNGSLLVKYVEINVNTDPTGRQFIFDGQTYTAPQTFKVAPSSSHTLDVPDPQYDGTTKRYVFDHWSDSGNKSHSITAPSTGAASYTAYFKTQYKLEVNVDPSAGGSVDLSINQTWFDENTTVVLTAVANYGYDFVNWTGTVNVESNPLTIQMTMSFSLTAHFKAWPQITITTDPAGQEVIIDGTTYTAPQTMLWQPGSQHTIGVNSPINVNEGKRYVYDRWSDGGAQTHTITTPNSDATYTAYFTTQYKLTVSNNPSAGGSIQVNPAGDWFDSGTQVTLQATANSGYQFVGWSGDLSGTTNPVNLTMDAAKTVTANYGEETQITINTNPQGMTIIVDGTQYTAPQTFTWLTNTTHTIGTNQYQQEANGKRYRWDNWSDGGAITHEITATKTTTSYTANFVEQFYLTTSVNPSGAGSVTPSSGWYDAGTQVELTATANQGYDFASWSGDASGSGNPVRITMNAAKSVTANFKAWPQITITTDPAGLEVIVDGTTYTAPQVFQWQPGTNHTIGVNSPQGGDNGIRYIYTSWSDGGDQTHQITTPQSNTTYTASFKTQYQLTTSVSPSGAGSITRNPDSNWYDAGTQVELTATANQGYDFASWSGDASGSGNPVQITMNAAKSVTANFKAWPQITITTDPAGLEVIVDGTTYTAPQVFQWQPGTNHTIGVNSPQGGDNGIRYIYTSWSDGGDQTHQITTPQSNTTYTASFKTQYQLTTSVSPSGAGSITRNPDSNWYDAGTQVELTASANQGYGFVNWSGDLSGSSNPATVTMDAAKQITANFGRIRQITIQTSPSGLPFKADGTTYNSTTTFDWIEGTSHSISVSSTVSAGTGKRYVWTHWSQGGSRSQTYTVSSSDQTLTAYFKTQYYLTTSVSPSGSGSVSPTSGWFDAGTTVNVEATPAQYYEFTGWSGDASGTSNPIQVLMDRAKSVTANFKLGQVTVTITTDPSGLTIWVDGSQYTSPRNFTWTIGSYHSIRVAESYDSAPGEQLWWQSWSDGGDRSHTVRANTSTTTYTAYFRKKFQLTLLSDYGSVTGDGWYWEGSNATIHVSSPVYNGDMTRHIFTRWSGDYTGSQQTAVINMSRPKTIRANWRTEYYIHVSSNISRVQDVFQTVEAEYGKIEAPMAVMIDSSASQCAYISSPAWHEGKAILQFYIPAEGFYWIWGRVYAPSGDEDSFWIRVDDNPDSILWDIGSRWNTWRWLELKDRYLGRQKFYFTQGYHRLHVLVREENSRLDKILITSDSTFTPGTLPGSKNTSYFLGNAFGSGWYEDGAFVSFGVDTLIEIDSTSHYVFEKWLFDYTDTVNTGRIRVDGPKTIIAKWRLEHWVQLAVFPPGTGTTDPPGPGDWFEHGILAQFTALPAGGYLFSHWSGSVSDTSATITVEIDTAKLLVANFAEPNHPPAATSVLLTPQNAAEDDTLTLQYTYADPDGDPEQGTLIRWYRNGRHMVDLDGQTRVLPDSLHAGDIWQASVIPSDGQDMGSAAFSNPVVILPQAAQQETRFLTWSGADTTVQINTPDVSLTATIRKKSPQGNTIQASGDSLPPIFVATRIRGSERFFFDNTVRSYWYIFTTLDSFEVDLEFIYSDSLLYEVGIHDETALVAGWSDNFGNDWFYVTPAEIDTANNKIRLTGIQHLSLWAIGIKPFSQFFPVQLSSFSAEALNYEKVRLVWITQSETDNRGFQVERSVNGHGFEPVAFVPGKGTSAEPQTYEFIDTVNEPGTYYYRLKQIDLDGSFTYSEAVEVTVSPPAVFKLMQNYPNPFNNETIIRFLVPEEMIGQKLSIAIYNVKGQIVWEGEKALTRAGIYKMTWKAVDRNYRPVPSGIYFLRLRVGQKTELKKMLYVK